MAPNEVVKIAKWAGFRQPVLSQADTKQLVDCLVDYLVWEATQEEADHVAEVESVLVWLRTDWWAFVKHVQVTVYRGKPQSRGKAVRRACREYRLDLG
jgi:hypothetical protein